ncbi:unnamed protein product, partial [Ectocarpus sp. 12 AP-2014]
QALEQRRAGATELLKNDPVLMERVRAMLRAGAIEKAAAKAAAVDGANTRALRASLQALKRHHTGNIGRIAYTTALAAAAGAGAHTCHPADPCRPGERCDSVEPGGVSFAARARSLEIRCKTFAEARSRMHNTNHDLAPEKALADGCYMYSERKTRSDATNPEVMALARLYWHFDDASLPTGNGDIHKESKKSDAPSHPRRQLKRKGDDVWRMFLKSQEYLALKAKLLGQDSEFTDPGRTKFLSTRCTCLVEPRTSQSQEEGGERKSNTVSR